MTRHLVHIGYPKAGSTFLQRWFESHPQLAYREGGLAGFHDVYAIARSAAVTDEGVAFRVTSFEGLLAPHAKAGQMFMNHDEREIDFASAQLRVCALLASLFPNAMVLIVTRGFRSMILSSYSQFLRSGGDVDLAHFMPLSQRSAGPIPWDYDTVIDAYTRAFGADNVIVMPYELLRDDEKEFTRWLAARLGIEPGFESHEAVNQSLSGVEMYWYPRLSRLVRRLRSRRLLGLYERVAFRNRLRAPIRLLQRLRPGTPVTAAALPDEIVNAFRGKAESLRGNPLYAPYAAEYLLQ